MNPELTHGTEGEWVSYLQQLLEAAGHSPGPIDGIFGPRTEAAVRSYQEAFQLLVDGIAGPETWAQLSWTWDWSEFPIFSALANCGADEDAVIAAIGYKSAQATA